MIQEKDKWIEDVLNSTKDGLQAKPSADLFNKISRKIENKSVKIIHLKHQKLAIAASIVWLMINGLTIGYYLNSNPVGDSESLNEVSTEESLLSNFNIYTK